MASLCGERAEHEQFINIFFRSTFVAVLDVFLIFGFFGEAIEEKSFKVSLIHIVAGGPGLVWRWLKEI